MTAANISHTFSVKNADMIKKKADVPWKSVHFGLQGYQGNTSSGSSGSGIQWVTSKKLWKVPAKNL